MQPDRTPISDSQGRNLASFIPVDVVRERHAATARPAAHIGRTIQVKGEITGDEDLIIDGRVEGKVLVGQHRVTIGPSGEVDADVRARWIVLAGTVRGNLTADDRVEIAPSGRLTGDIRSPRLLMNEGAVVKGGIETNPGTARKATA